MGLFRPVRRSVLDFIGRCDPSGEAGPCLVAQKLRGWQRALGTFFAEFAIEKGVVEPGARGIGGAAAVIDGIEARPVGRREAHGARLATGVKLAAGKPERAEPGARSADSIYFTVSCGIVGGGDRVCSLSDNFAVTNDQRGKRPTPAAGDVLRRERNGAAHEVRVNWHGTLGLDLSLPERRK